MRRSDGSGTTFIFTDYLSKANAEWKSKVGSGTAVEWPVGVGAKGNEGVAGNVGQTKNSIGYVEYAYAKQNKLTYAGLINKAGKTVQPTIAAFQAAAANADWAKAPGYYVILTDQPGDASWPITGCDLHPHAQASDRQGGRGGSDQVLQVGVREGRQDGRRARLHPDAGHGRQADREDLVGRHQELSLNGDLAPAVIAAERGILSFDGPTMRQDESRDEKIVGENRFGDVAIWVALN